MCCVRPINPCASGARCCANARACATSHGGGERRSLQLARSNAQPGLVLVRDACHVAGGKVDCEGFVLVPTRGRTSPRLVFLRLLQHRRCCPLPGIERLLLRGHRRSRCEALGSRGHFKIMQAWGSSVHSSYFCYFLGQCLEVLQASDL